MSPAVTIGMPVYNGAAMIEQAIAGLSAQTFKDMRILVADNASTDATPELLAAWAARDSRVEIHRHAENIGACRNFVWVARNSTSPYFMFAAHDDCWSPNYVQSLLQALQSKPDAPFAVGVTILMTHDWQPLRQLRTPRPSSRSKINTIRRQLSDARPGWFYGLHRREALASVIPKMQNYGHTWGNDFVLMFPLLLTTPVAFAPEAIFYQRLGSQSHSLYRPDQLSVSWAMHQAAQRECFKSLTEADLTPIQKAILAPYVFRYASKASMKLRDMLTQRALRLFDRGRKGNKP